jgi:hypothetical protein
MQQLRLKVLASLAGGQTSAQALRWLLYLDFEKVNFPKPMGTVLGSQSCLHRGKY